MPTPRALVHLAFAGLIALPCPPGSPDPANLSGAPSPQSDPPPSRALLQELTSATRLAGTSGSERGAEWVAGVLRAAGWRTELDRREVLLSLPRQVDLRVFEDVLAEAPVHESYAGFDPDQVPAGDVPPFSAWSASGRVRGQVIDAGYGLRSDYERLRAARVDTEGKVALVRYGRAYRGVKVAVAAEYGCAAVLLFSDPEGDGPARGDTWPVGRWKPAWDAQRGAILDIAQQPGDPSTPGFPSPAPGRETEPGGPLARLDAQELEAILPRIPCLPIGSGVAEDIRAKLRVRRIAPVDAPVDEAGASTGDGADQVVEKKRLPVGPGPVEVEVHVDAPRELRTIVNVIARLDGHSAQTVLLGNHRDAWVRGAHDAGSGTVALLRAAQILGERARAGWTPDYSIAMGFWDAEEFGLIGSTEWAEGHGDWVREQLLAYVNGDAVVGGPRLFASGSPGMETILVRALAGLADPNDRGRSLAEAWLDGEGAAGRLRLPGSGSDFTVFAHHFQVPVLDLGFGGSSGGQYHTSFDDFRFVERFIDPDFSLHELAGQTFAALATELASAGPLALDEAWAAEELARHAREAQAALGSEAAERLAAGFESLAAAIRDTWAAWDSRDGARQPIEAGFRRGEAPSIASVPRDPVALADRSSRAVRELALGATGERLYARLALPNGLADRPWYRNALWAPGADTGYAAETFPQLRALAGQGEDTEPSRTAAFEAELEGLLEAIDGHRRAWIARAPAPD